MASFGRQQPGSSNEPPDGNFRLGGFALNGGCGVGGEVGQLTGILFLGTCPYWFCLGRSI